MPMDFLGRAISLVVETEVIMNIDASDECPEDEVRDMVSFLESATQDACNNSCRHRECLSIGHYPYIVIT